MKKIEKMKEELKEINRLSNLFAKYEMTSDVKIEIDRILVLSSSEPNKVDEDEYENFLNVFFEIDDCLSEILMLTGDMMKRVNNMSINERDNFYKKMGINKIEDEDIGISDKRIQIIRKIKKIIDKYLQSITTP